MHANATAPETPTYGQRIVVGILVLACLYWASPVVMVLIVSMLLVFLCDPVVTWISSHHVPRGIAAFLAVLVMIGAAYLIFLLFYTQLQNFAGDFPKYSDRLRRHVLLVKEKAEQIQQPLNTMIGEEPLPAPAQTAPQGAATGAPVQPQAQTQRPRNTRRAQRQPEPSPPESPVPAVSPRAGAGFTWSGTLGSNLRSATELVFLVSFIPFLVYFSLTWKDHIRRTSIALFGFGNRMAAERSIDGITTMIRGFVLGNVIIGVILSVASGLFFWIMRLPYPAIMGPVSGFLSLVPYLGAPLAALPPVLAAYGQYTALAPVVATLLGVVALHLTALNVLYPKLIGSRVHLNPVVVTIALLFWGWLWGGIGLVLAIPITGGIKAVCDNVPSLKLYGRLMAD